MNDYDININYHPGKTNVVDDALSRKVACNPASLLTCQNEILRDMEKLNMKIYLQSLLTLMMALHVQQELLEIIKTKQLDDPFLTRLGKDIKVGQPSEFQRRVDGSIWF